MFDAEDDDLIGVCRDETCEVEHAHAAHVFPFVTGGDDEQRGRPKKPWWLERDPTACRRSDPDGVVESVQRLFARTKWPLAFTEICSFVRNDYGPISGRTLHRYLRGILNDGKLRRLDLGLTFAAYIAADSPFLGDEDNLREHLLGKHTMYQEGRVRRRGRHVRQLQFAGAL